MALTHVAARLAQGCTIAHALRKFARVQDAWIFVDEASQVPLSTLGEISRWGLVGCKFIIVEDRIGQFLPIFDTWKVDLRKLPNGSLIKNMCGGFHLQLDTYRRGTDQSLFDFYTGFYNTDVDDASLTSANVQSAIRQYPIRETTEIDVYFVLSHRKRVLLNSWMNNKDAQSKCSVLVKSVGPLSGTTAPTQDMMLYQGLELIGCSGVNGRIVNGVIYIVKEATPERVVVEMAEEFRTSMMELTNAATRDKLKDILIEYIPVLLSVLEKSPLSPATLARKAVQCQSALKRLFPTFTAHARWHALTQLFPDKLAPYGSKIALKDSDEGAGVDEPLEFVELSHKEASTQLRLTYALTFASIQGRTIRDKHICLMDTHHKKYFTTRHLIVGVSRATHGSYVHVPTERQEELIMKKAYGKADDAFLKFIDRQEHLSMSEPLDDVLKEPIDDPTPAFFATELQDNVAVQMGESRTTVQSLIQTQIAAQPSHLQGSARLRCEPCFNTLKSTEYTCVFCKRSREEIMAARV